jgi:hypothetical protein
MGLFNKYLLIGFLFIFGYMTCFKVSHRKKIHALKAGYAIKCKGKVSPELILGRIIVNRVMLGI